MSIENMEKILCLNADALSKGGEYNKEHVLFNWQHSTHALKLI